MATQEELIGVHPVGGYLNGLIAHSDEPVSADKCHRRLTFTHQVNPDDIRNLASLMVKSHYPDGIIAQLKSCYANLGYGDYKIIRDNLNHLPSADKIKKGNFCESLLQDYILAMRTGELFTCWRFRYNPNVNTSMRGDDVLMLEIQSDGTIKMYLGEAKFRGKPSKAVLDEIKDALKKNKHPLSYHFLLDKVLSNGDARFVTLAKIKFNDLIKTGNLIYVGLLFSNASTGDYVNNKWTLTNPTHVILSLGCDNCEQLVNDTFAEANNIINNGAAGV